MTILTDPDEMVVKIMAPTVEPAAEVEEAAAVGEPVAAGEAEPTGEATADEGSSDEES